MTSRATSARRKTSRRGSPSRVSYEEIEIRTEDGVALRARMDDPPEGVAFVGTCVLAHAMFARKSEFGRPDKPGLAAAWSALGWRTIAFDFRGHGDSAIARAWSYDDLVRFDLPAVVACARARGDEKPVIVAGHSLGGHVALAAQGTGRLEADGVISIAGNVWLRAFEPSRLRWAAKIALMRGMLVTARRRGVFPARALRLGSDDAAAPYVEDIARGVFEGTWRSADHADDYLARLADVRVPVCSVASDGDRVNCHPQCAEAFVRHCAGPVEIVRIVHADDGGAPPGHMEIVTTDRAKATLARALAWMKTATTT